MKRAAKGSAQRPAQAARGQALRKSLALALLALSCAGARANDIGLDDFVHERWSAGDGAPPQIRAMAQTPDGWLWIGTADGLFRFDGVRFERYALPPRSGLSSERISHLATGPDGKLYISFFAEGLSVLHPDGRTEDLQMPPSPLEAAGSMKVDADGTLWIVSRGIMRHRGGRWQTVEAGPEWVASDRRTLLLDGRGRLWAANEHATWRLDRAADRFAKVRDDGGDLLLAPDGRVWLAGADGALALLDADGGARPDWYGRSEARDVGHFDRDGTLWLLNCPQPVCLLSGAAARTQARYAARREAAASSAAAPRLSGEQAMLVLEDREGSVWVATERGLDRFRRKRFAASGLPGAGNRYSLAADGAGRMWAADAQAGILWRLYPDRPPEAQRGRPVTLVAAGRLGSVLVGRPRGIERRNGDGVEEIPLPPGPDGKPADLHMLGILDDGKVLWTATLETGLIGWRDGKWLPRAAFRLPPKIYQSAPGGVGQLWLATGDGKLVLYDDGRLAETDIRALGMGAAIFPGTELTISGTAGMDVVKDGRLHMLRAAEPDVLRNVSGLVATQDGDRWLNGGAGVVHVRAADWRRSMDDPAQPLRYELFDKLDGYPGQAVIDTRWASAASPDDRNLWLVATGGVARLDTAALQRNPVAPTPVILRLASDAATYAPAGARNGALRLPPGTDRFRIDFTAPALRKPARVRFEYRLDGVDAAWQDAGTRRSTSYTNIGPGNYVFRLRAVNEDGVPGRSEAVLPLGVAPTLGQSTWFRALCAAAAGLLGVALYRWRVRWLTARLAERMRVKTAERERIARTLHDTFLQTVQGLVLRVDAVAASLPQGDRARSQLENVLEDAGSAIGEGRDRLQELRAGDDQALEDLLGEAVARLGAVHGIAIELAVEGERRPLHRSVAAEVADLAREALRNACAHAGAGQVRVRLDYGRRALLLAVSDDGVGIPAEVLRAGGRSGHWGLAGMRELAQRLGARLDIGPGPRGGTLVGLAVPAARAYVARRAGQAA